MIAIMLILVLAVIGTAASVLYWFFRRLKRIETELWGDKRREATDTAQSLAAEDSHSDGAAGPTGDITSP